jgi:hypothetical protein
MTRWKGGCVTKEGIEDKVEVDVGHRIFASDNRPRFVEEVVRFKGEYLGFYKAEDFLDDSRLKRTEISYSLYRCPGGYRVHRSELHSQRLRERSGWQRKEAFLSLLPTVDEEGVGRDEQTPNYGLYTEEEARRTFPRLFSAVGMPNVRNLD